MRCLIVIVSGLLVALPALTRAAATPPPDAPEAALLRSIEQLREGDFNTGLDGLRSLVERQPNFRLAQLLYGQLLAERSGVAGAGVIAPTPQDVAVLNGLQAELKARVNGADSGPAPGAVPSNILQLPASTSYAVAVDLRRSRLYLLGHDRHGLHLLRSYYASIARQGFGKTRAGDLRTPVGIYHITSWKPGKRLAAIYGAGAFPVSYPNAWDRAHGRTGYGIWLHGVPHSTYVRPPRTSEGCVVLANSDLLALKPYLQPGSPTPVIFSDDLHWQPQGTVDALKQQLDEAIKGWQERWSALDTRGYLAYYADDFHTDDGMDRAAFARYKRRVNAGKRYIHVGVKNLALFRYPGTSDVVMARFTQVYKSNNYAQTSRKQQFWRRQPDGRWKIVLEADD